MNKLTLLNAKTDRQLIDEAIEALDAARHALRRQAIAADTNRAIDQLDLMMAARRAEKGEPMTRSIDRKYLLARRRNAAA